MKFTFLSLLIMAAFSGKAQSGNDSLAIVKLLETESATWRAGDAKAHAACWHIRPYSKIVISTADGKLLDIPPGLMLHPPQGMMGKGGSAVNSNYTFSIQGLSAWVGHNEISTAADGTQSYSYEIRMLEKIKGNWKLVAQSIHSYKLPESQAASNGVPNR